MNAEIKQTKWCDWRRCVCDTADVLTGYHFANWVIVTATLELLVQVQSKVVSDILGRYYRLDL